MQRKDEKLISRIEAINKGIKKANDECDLVVGFDNTRIIK